MNKATFSKSSAGSKALKSDLFGNIATKVNGGNTTTYSYNFERNLTGIDFPSTANDDSHEYDGDGVRMRSKLAGATDWTNFIVCPVTGNLLCEYTLISSTFTIKSVNTWGIGLISTNREETIRYFHFDGIGSTAALTDNTGLVTDTYSYSAFGVTESSTGSSVNPFRYIGQFGYYDDTARGSNSGLLLLGVRYYSPSRGTFISWDSMRLPNSYNYVRKNVTQSIDPSGRMPLGLLPSAATGFGQLQTAMEAELVPGPSQFKPPRFSIDSYPCKHRRSEFGVCVAAGFGNWDDTIIGHDLWPIKQSSSGFDAKVCGECCISMYYGDRMEPECFQLFNDCLATCASTGWGFGMFMLIPTLAQFGPNKIDFTPSGGRGYGR